MLLSKSLKYYIRLVVSGISRSDVEGTSRKKQGAAGGRSEKEKGAMRRKERQGGRSDEEGAMRSSGEEENE